MVRYCKQQDKYTCGPIAFLNLLKWQGKSATYKKTLPWLKKQLKTTKIGTYPANGEKFIKKHFKNVSNQKLPFYKIKNQLLKNKSFIFYYNRFDEVNLDFYAHVFFISGIVFDKQNKAWLITHNYPSVTSVYYIREDEFKRFFMKPNIFESYGMYKFSKES